MSGAAQQGRPASRRSRRRQRLAGLRGRGLAGWRCGLRDRLLLLGWLLPLGCRLLHSRLLLLLLLGHSQGWLQACHGRGCHCPPCTSDCCRCRRRCCALRARCRVNDRQHVQWH